MGAFVRKHSETTLSAGHEEARTRIRRFERTLGLFLRPQVGEHSKDAAIVERLRQNGMGPTPLSRCSLRRSTLNGLMIGYTNVGGEEAAAAAERMRAAMT